MVTFLFGFKDRILNISFINTNVVIYLGYANISSTPWSQLVCADYDDDMLLILLPSDSFKIYNMTKIFIQGIQHH